MTNEETGILHQEPPLDQMRAVVAGMIGKRLMYRDLTAPREGSHA